MTITTSASASELCPVTPQSHRLTAYRWSVKDMDWRSVGEDRQLAELDQPLAIALDETIFRAAHRGSRHLAVLVATHGLPVGLVQCLSGFRKRDAHVADDVVQIRCRQSLRLVVVTPLNEVRDDLTDLLASFADVAVRIDNRILG